MAADQLNKRSKSSNVIRHTSWEIQKAKKKKSSHHHHDLNIKSNISLEWDEKKEQVVPKKEQIGIPRRELTPFLPVLPHSQNALGDVFAAPSELFQLDNLTGLLSYEVWQTHLSAQERGFLTQFLPEGVEPHKIVHELLGGNNFYFGNPFMKWGSSVCLGDCHPDAILTQEQCNKANKIAYYSELHKYHTKMIGNLQLWKEKWASCVNPENEFTQKILRSRKDFHKSGSLHEEDEFGATSDSYSWDADDKFYSSDSPNLAITNGETIMRVSKMDLENKFYDSSGERRLLARPRKGDKIRKLNIECGDGAKYMSYIKVSKEQHERVKSSMKHSNTSIQPRSLNHVLGNLDSFCVQPYEVFEEEERQNLHHHWLNLVKRDLPAGYENWKSWQSAKCEVTKSLRIEIEDKRKSNDLSVSNLYCHNEENEESQILLLHGDHNANLDNGLVNSEDEEEQEQLVGDLCDEQLSDEETNDVLLVAPEDTMERNEESLFQSEPDVNDTNETGMQIEETDESSEDSARNHHLPPIIHNNNQNFCPINNDVLTEPDPFSSTLHEYTENMSQPDAPVSQQQFPLPPAATEIWPSTTLPTSYYHQPPPVVTLGYDSIGELSLGHPQIRRSDGGGGGGCGDSFFYPYANQDTRNELLLHSLFKDPGSSYLHEHKLSRLGYHPTGGDPVVAAATAFPRHLSNIQENIFADGGGRFSIPRQEHLLPLHDWPGNTTHQPIQNWFSGDDVARDGWSGNQDIGNGCVTGGGVADESLYSVLSQCNGLRSGVNFGSSGEFIQSGSYGGIGRPVGSNGVASRAGLNYMSGNEGQSGAGGAGSNGLGWMSLPKSFQRSWNANELG